MKTDEPSKKQKCTPKPARTRTAPISLPIIDPETGMKRSRAGRWRAYVLGGVHVFMIAHFVHWLYAGITLAPVEPSEAMETIRYGAINMGFIFFGVAILSTLILGRWVCGWACHFVAYQDLTLWILKKLHLRPRAFRTRFLFIVTTLVIAAGWMFFLPLGARMWSMIQGHAQPQLSMHLTKTGYWDTFPGVLFAVLSVLFAGIVIIYFLGPKGFCTYACPYGAIFATADRFAPVRIRVNDDCNQCGHCTAVCTSNVDVAQEVNLYKMVVDPGCMKCLDCVQVCPNDALRVGLGPPAISAKPAAPRKPRKFDLSLTEEIAALGVFVFVLVTVNGLYGEFPFLMSLAIAGICTFVLMKGARMIYAPDVMLQKARLKINGRITRTGFGVSAALILLVIGLVHSAIWRYHDLLASRAFAAAPQQSINWQYDPDFRQLASPEQIEQARAAAGHYEAMQRIGLVSVPVHRLHLAWLYLFLEREEDALAQARWAVEERPDLPLFWLWRAKVATLLGRLDEADSAYARALDIERAAREPLAAKVPNARHPISAEIHSEWGRFLFMKDGPGRAEAATALADAVQYDPGLDIAQISLLDFYLSTNQIDRARRAAIDAIGHGIGSRQFYERLERIRMFENNPAKAAEDYRAAIKAHPDNIVLMGNFAAALAESGRLDEAERIGHQALALDPVSPGLTATLGGILAEKGDFAAAIPFFEKLCNLLPDSGEAAVKLAMLYARVGRMADAARSLERATTIGSEHERAQARQMLQQLRASTAQPQP